MPVTAEVRTVPLVETSFVRFTPDEIPRVRQKESMSAQTVREGFTPQGFAFPGEVGNPWPLFQNLSPYNGRSNEVAVVTLDTSDRYLPDPHRVPAKEGAAVMGTIGNIVQFLEEELPSHSVYVGYNWSPRAYGVEEYKGGYASLTSKFHVHVWNLADAPEMVSINHEKISDGARWAIQGDKYKRAVADLLLMPLVAHHGANLIDQSSLRVDERGVVAKLNYARLSDAMKDPEFFAFLQSFDADFDRAARDVTEATTLTEFEELDNAMQYAFEHGTDGIFPMLEQDPVLRPLSERTKKLEELREKGYPVEFVDFLKGVNPFLKNRDKVKESSWIRKGLAYAFVASEDLGTGQVEIRISPGIFVGDRGGPVETRGIAIKRKEVAEATPEEIQQRKANLAKLKEYMAKAA